MVHGLTRIFTDYHGLKKRQQTNGYSPRIITDYHGLHGFKKRQRRTATDNGNGSPRITRINTDLKGRRSETTSVKGEWRTVTDNGYG